MTGALRLLDVTLPSPAENLALDEALLDQLEDEDAGPVLRFWESDRHFVVLGRSCSQAHDVEIEACEHDGVPVLRRASGGGTVLQGPGCLSYAFVLPLALDPRLADIRHTYQFMLERIAAALRPWEPDMAFRGVSDLAIGDMKVSGNAQRRTRRSVLFHGTLLHGMTADRIARYLKHPSKQPDYRRDRLHGEFLGRVRARPEDMKRSIAAAWSVCAPCESWPATRLPHKVREILQRGREMRIS